MKFRFALVFALQILFVPVSVRAEQPPGKLQIAQELVELLKYDQVFQGHLKQCLEPKGSYFDPHSTYQADPAAFGGISPESAHWKEIEQIYRRYQERVCGYSSPNEFAQFFAKAYAERVSEEDLRAAVSFYRSPGGARFQLANVQITQLYQEWAQSTLNSVFQRENQKASEEVKAVVERYHRR